MKATSAFNTRLAEELSGSSIRDIFKNANNSTLKDIADMSLGNPFGKPPDSFSKALIKLIKSNPNHSYMDNAGYYDAREAVAEFLVRGGLMPEGLKAEHTVISAGCSGGLNCVLKSLINTGDEVLVLAPYFPDFLAYVENHGGVSVVVKLKPDKFEPDIRVIEKHLSQKTKAVIINSPNNPTGNVYTASQIGLIHELLRNTAEKIGHPIYLISDETYRDLIYSDSSEKIFNSPAKDYPYSIVVYSFSKSASVPGERIGYVAVNPKMPEGETLINLVSLSQRKLGFTNAPALMQMMMRELLAIRPDLQDYENKRNLINSALTQGQYSFNKPGGAFYFFVKYPFPEGEFLKSARGKGLYVVPGRAFGEQDFFRIAFSRDMSTINLAAKLIVELRK